MAKLTDDNVGAAGIAWIREEDYATLLAVFEDGYKFVGGWKEWVKLAEVTEADLRGRGYIVERVYLDPDTFSAWCFAEGVGTGQQARVQFAAEAVANKYGRDPS